MIATRHRPTYSRFVRGKRNAHFDAYGWDIRCTCGWDHRHNGPKREAMGLFKDHLRDMHRAMVGLTLAGVTV